MSHEVLDTIAIILLVATIASHFVGCHLLVCIYRNGQDTVQEMLLINLSIAACSNCIITLLVHTGTKSSVLQGEKGIMTTAISVSIYDRLYYTSTTSTIFHKRVTQFLRSFFFWNSAFGATALRCPAWGPRSR